MGGCASRPKDIDDNSNDAPEAPVTPTKAQAEAVAQENNTDGAESEKKEEPLVDLSEAKEEKDSEEAPAAESEEPAKEEAQKDEIPNDEPVITV